MRHERAPLSRRAPRHEAGFTPSSGTILHSTPPATQRASLSRSGELTVASFIKIIDSGHQDSQYLATLTFDATAGAAQDECPASPSPTVVGWMATRMAATPTTVARWMPVPIAVPLAACQIYYLARYTVPRNACVLPAYPTGF